MVEVLFYGINEKSLVRIQHMLLAHYVVNRLKLDCFWVVISKSSTVMRVYSVPIVKI